jgi:deoxyribonuclease-4
MKAPKARRIGLHTSIAGSIEKAALKAVEFGANTFQIFSSSPRMWRAAPLAPSQVQLFRQARERFDLRPLVIHDNYLINLASQDETVRAQSVAAFRGEIERALMIGAEYLVAHPGNRREQTVEAGIVSVVRSLAEASRGLDTTGLTVLLENTAGAGGALGCRFEELESIRAHAEHFCDLRIGFCIDTCHCLAAGYDIASQAGFDATLAELEARLGLDRIAVIHANDSKGELGSHLDRHEQVGKGHIGLDGFRRILNHPQLQQKAFILEVPIEEDGDEVRNIEALKSLCQDGRRRSQRPG